MSQKRPYFNVDVDVTQDLAFGGPCEIFWGTAYNTHSAVQFLKLYDKATAAEVTVGTTVPQITIAIPPTNNIMLSGLSFKYGLVVAATLLAATSDTTDTSAAVILSMATG